MNYLMEFLGTDEVKIVLVIGMLICVLGMIYFTIEKYLDSKRKKKNTEELNKFMEDLELLEDVEEEKPVLEEILEPITNKEVVNNIIENPVNKEVVTNNTIEKEDTKTEPIKESVEQIYTAVKQEVISNKQLDSSPKPVQSTENNKIEKIEYTDIRPNEEEAKEEIRKVTEELLKAQEIEENKEKIDNSKSELDKFEEEQEESAIISMEEFMKKGNTLYALNEEKQYKDEGNEPISLQDLEKRFTTINNFAEEIKQTTKVEEKPDTKKKVVLDDFNTINSMAYSEEHIFKNSPIISPIFGIEQNSSVENIELENTANYDKLDNEIRKTNEFLGKLKELKEKLN